MTDVGERLQGILDHLILNRTDNDAWIQLYTVLWPRVFAIAYRHLRGQHDLAEDACQEAFIRLLRYADFSRLNRAEVLLAYLSTVALNASRDIAKGHAAANHLSGDEVDALSEDVPSAEDVTTNVVNQETLQTVWEEVDSADKKLVALLAQGADLRELADATGLSRTNVGVRVYRLRQRLRKILKKLEN